MKKILLTLLFLIVCVLAVSAEPAANPTVRVGLYYNNSALPTANLQNVEGCGYGYRFGYYDTTHTFIQQYSTAVTNRISMLKDKNLYYYDGKFYESGAPSGSILIGAYHIELADAYATQEEAEAFVSILKSSGVNAFVAINNNLYKIRIGSYGTAAAAEADIPVFSQYGVCSVIGNRNECFTVVDTSNGNILFEYDNNTSLAVYPSLGEVEMPLTWFKGYKYYGGFQYMRGDANIAVINFVPMQEYTKGVVPYEMSPSWPLEALKAQALCARTYALYNYGKHGKNFDVCATTDCQVYHGANSASELTDRAVDETFGQYILYDGKPINAVFSSSDGGATENSENVWSAVLPYLRGVIDNNEDLDTCTNGRWTFEYTTQEIEYILKSKGYDCASVVDMYVKEFTPTGNVLTLTVVDSNGKTFNFSKERARTILYSSTYKKYTHSQRYTVKRKGENSASMIYINNASSTADFSYETVYTIGNNGVKVLPKSKISIMTASGVTTFDPNKKSDVSNVDKNVFVVSGTGWGHNVGMSQNGAKSMALNGKTAEDIIHFYYTDVEIFNAR